MKTYRTGSRVSYGLANSNNKLEFAKITVSKWEDTEVANEVVIEKTSVFVDRKTLRDIGWDFIKMSFGLKWHE